MSKEYLLLLVKDENGIKVTEEIMRTYDFIMIESKISLLKEKYSNLLIYEREVGDWKKYDGEIRIDYWDLKKKRDI